MAEPIRNKRENIAPTPQNTPASVSSLQPPSRSAGGSAPSMESIREGAGLGALANNPALLSMIQGRLGTLVGKSSNYIESLPVAVRDRLAGLKALRLENAKIEAEFQRDLLELEKKYFSRHEPLYAQRAKIIAGDAEPTPEEVETGQAAFEEEDELFGSDEEHSGDEDEDAAKDGEDTEMADDKDEAPSKAKDNEIEEELDSKTAPAGIPDFWLTALKNLPGVGELISERDDEILDSLEDVRLKYLDKPGFALEFVFSDNAYFTNQVLTKTYFYQDDIGITGDFVYDHAEGDTIKWTSPETNVTVKVEKRKQRNKHTKATRTIEKTIPVESFFNFFSPPQPPTDEDDEYDEDIQDRLESDFDMGELIKEKLIPRAIDWFTGKALEYEGIGAGDEEEPEFDEDEEDDVDDDDADADDADGDKKQPECKQQ